MSIPLAPNLMVAAWGIRISRSIVESRSGHLWAADNSSRGAEVSISRLPIDSRYFRRPEAKFDAEAASDGSEIFQKQLRKKPFLRVRRSRQDSAK